MDKRVSSIRIDKWLWRARFFKSRAKAGKAVESGGMRVNAVRVGKAAAAVGPGDVLTLPVGSLVRVVRIESVGERRGPAKEARTLYTDLYPPPGGLSVRKAGKPEPALRGRNPGTGRPTGRERRKIDALRGSRA